MNSKKILSATLVVLVLFLSACSALATRQPTPTPTSSPAPTATLAPTSTHLPTSTATPVPSPTLTPIPGAETPILVDGFGFQVSSGSVGGEPPNDFRINLAFNKPMILDFALTGVDSSTFADFLDTMDSLAHQLVVVDEHANAATPSNSFFNLNPEGGVDNITFYFAVPKDATTFSLKFPDGQTVDLTPLLEFE